VEDLGADVNLAGEDGWTPLNYAACMGRLDVVLYFVKELGFDANQASIDGMMPFSAAAKNGKLEAVLCLGKELGSDVNLASKVGHAPLHIAARSGNLELVMCMCQLGADVNQRAVNGATPVLIASEFGHLAVLVYLAKELAADINLPIDKGMTAVIIAAQNGHLDVVVCMPCQNVRCGDQWNHACLDCDRSRPSRISDMPVQGLAQIDGTTPLYNAAEEGNVDTVRLLVKVLGAEVNITKEGGFTPLMAAARNNNQPMIKHLVHKGALVRAVSTTGTAQLRCSDRPEGALHRSHIWRCESAAPTRTARVVDSSVAPCTRRRGTAGWRVVSRTGGCIG
jgi:ankyrin repeat protein